MAELESRIDALFTLRAKRLQAQKEVDALEAEEKELGAAIKEDMMASGQDELSGHLGKFKLKYDQAPVVVDWTVLYNHILETGNFDLLHKRLGVAAVKERWQGGDDVPGVGREDTVTYYVGKA